MTLDRAGPLEKKKGLVKLYIKFKIRSKPLLFHYCIFKEQKFSHQSQIYLTGVQPWKCYIYHYYQIITVTFILIIITIIIVIIMVIIKIIIIIIATNNIPISINKLYTLLP